MATAANADPLVLTSWKDIARYVGKGVRTVQRWEHEFGLPVRRPLGVARKSAVAARPHDLDTWLTVRWKYRTRSGNRVVAAPQHACQAALTDLSNGIRTARDLRTANHALMYEVSTALQALIRTCDHMAGCELSGAAHAAVAGNLPR